MAKSIASAFDPERKETWPKIGLILFRENNAEKTDATWTIFNMYGSLGRPGFYWNGPSSNYYLVLSSDITVAYPDLHYPERREGTDYIFCNIPDTVAVFKQLKASYAHSYSFRMIQKPAPTLAMAKHIVAMTTWKQREADKFASGEYTALPWANEDWYKNCDRVAEHFAHISKKNPGKIAYTPNTSCGIENKRIMVSPLRYLYDWFASYNYCVNTKTNEELSKLANDFRALCGSAYDLHYAITEDEWEDVYTNGPDSCMSKDASDYNTDGYHPVRVYAAGDLQLAYLLSRTEDGEGDIVARAIVWPAKKIYVRAYGEYASDLQNELRMLGYQEGSLKGARLLLERRGFGIVCPYLDSGGWVSIAEDYLIIGNDCTGDHEARNTDGIICSAQCERCEDGCEDTREVQVRANTYEMWCERCQDNHSFYCDLSSRYYSTDRYDSIPLARGGYARRSDAEEADYFECLISGDWYHPDYLLGYTEDGEAISIDYASQYARCSLSNCLHKRSLLVPHPHNADEFVLASRLDELTEEADGNAPNTEEANDCAQIALFA